MAWTMRSGTPRRTGIWRRIFPKDLAGKRECRAELLHAFGLEKVSERRR